MMWPFSIYFRRGYEQAWREAKQVGNTLPHCGYCGCGCPYCKREGGHD